jgi:hypothetical protein
MSKYSMWWNKHPRLCSNHALVCCGRVPLAVREKDDECPVCDVNRLINISYGTHGPTRHARLDARDSGCHVPDQSVTDNWTGLEFRVGNSREFGIGARTAARKFRRKTGSELGFRNLFSHTHHSVTRGYILSPTWPTQRQPKITESPRHTAHEPLTVLATNWRLILYCWEMFSLLSLLLLLGSDTGFQRFRKQYEMGAVSLG